MLSFSRRGEDDPFHHLCIHELADDSDPLIILFLEWMGDAAIGNPQGVRFSLDKVFRAVCLPPGDGRKRKHRAEDPLSLSEKNLASGLVARVKEYIDRCYEFDAHDPTSRLFVDMPATVKRTRPGGRMMMMVTSTPPVPFQDRKLEHRKLLAAKRKQNGADAILSSCETVHSFWKTMLSPVSGIGLLIYSNEQPELPPTTQAALGDRYSASEDVAAAFLVGQAISNQKIRFDPSTSVPLARSMIVTHDRLIKNWKCLVMLGAPGRNAVLDRLRTQIEWEEYQTYHFDRRGKKTVLVKGARGKSEGKPLIPNDMTDFAAISYLQNAETGQIVITMAGTRAVGNLGAAKVLCNEEWVNRFINQLPFKDEGPIPSFEVMLEISLNQLDRSIPEDFKVLSITLPASQKKKRA